MSDEVQYLSESGNVWFWCKMCRRNFPRGDLLALHKQEKHRELFEFQLAPKKVKPISPNEIKIARVEPIYSMNQSQPPSKMAPVDINTLAKLEWSSLNVSEPMKRYQENPIALNLKRRWTDSEPNPVIQSKTLKRGIDDPENESKTGMTHDPRIDEVKTEKKLNGYLVPQLFLGKRVYVCRICLKIFSSLTRASIHVTSHRDLLHKLSISCRPKTNTGSSSGSGSDSDRIKVKCEQLTFLPLTQLELKSESESEIKCPKAKEGLQKMSLKIEPLEVKGHDHVGSLKELEEDWTIGRETVETMVRKNLVPARLSILPSAGKKKDKDNLNGGHVIVKSGKYDEPTIEHYCICHQVSYGNMICCDNSHCPIQWFHFPCVGIKSKPRGLWFCPNCKPN